MRIVELTAGARTRSSPDEDFTCLGLLANELLGSAAAPQDLAAKAVSLIADMLDAHSCLIVIADPVSGLVEARAVSARTSSLAGDAVTVQLRAAAVAAVDAAAPVRFSGPAASGKARSVSGVCVPLPTPGNVLALSRVGAAPLADSEVDLLTTMGRLMALVSGQSRLLAQLARMGERRRGLASVLTEAEVYEAAVEALKALLEAEAVAAAVFHDGVATFQSQQGLKPAVAAKWRCSVSRLVAREALRTGKAFTTTDVRRHAQLKIVKESRLRAAVAAPVLVEGEPVAMLYGFRRVATPFSETDVHLITLVAAQVAATLANRRLLDQAQRRRERAEMLRRLAEDLSATEDTSAVLDSCAEAMFELCGAQRVTMVLLDEDSSHLVPVSCYGEEAATHLANLRAELPRISASSTSTVAEALRTGAPVLRRFGRKPPSSVGAVYRRLSDCKWLIVSPLLARNEAVGVALIEWGQSALDPDFESLQESLIRIGALVGSSLRQMRLLGELRREREQLRALHDVSISIVESPDEQATLHRIVESAISLTGAQAAWVALLEPDGRSYRVAELRGNAHVRAGELFPVGKGASGWAITHGQPVQISDWQAGVVDPVSAKSSVASRSRGSAICVPLIGRGGQAVGCLAVTHAEPYALPRSLRDVLERLAAEATVAVESARHVVARERLEQQLRRQAYHDQLTGLANRLMLLERLRRCLEDADVDRLVGLLYLDLDRFKTVNDSLGHAGGDLLLAGVARRLASALRPDDLLARLGGDEFIVLLDRLQSPREAELVARRLLTSLENPIVFGDTEVHVGVSIGIALHAGREGSAEELMRDADIAMYQAKAAGRGDFALYEPAMGALAGARLSLENDLRHAINGGGLHVYYQPIIELASGNIFAVEALSRWPHPRRGSVPPDEFIALAEETGLIESLDASVLSTATADIRDLQRRFGRPDLRLNVNLSAARLHRASLAAQIATTLADTGFDPARLTLEITETAVMHEPERVLPSLTRLHDLGMRIVMDDFGTGYSNLSYLKRYPLAGLKLDRTFVGRLGQEPADETIVAAVATMGKALGLDVTAEGVETFEQAQLLKRLGCRLAQGFFYSPAVPLAELPALLAASEVPTQRRLPVSSRW
ncbi:MAG: EAL domain-containing protein [Mycobacteriales bacterium]